ncbi:hypothetical protein [Candidatus Xianfuyuplasma coldseepsis]|uniref:Uncharacterized protein n=1 Tax=Candidatus Xianfuyuplasma coldseepsis TaxID=2782163 RepID=A0A7L7KP06_9MOLU|nr:hypothetical protein [Xianfuyuplasma coldseepsis]QMS84510.1 hypothetical protein G4Z02_01685 [Xianfuyuplasma coldseepsis]
MKQMDELLNCDDIDRLQFYLDYYYMIQEMNHKRDQQDEELAFEIQQLEQRKQELLQQSDS